MLDPPELKRRLIAARTLRHLNQAELAAKCEQLGLGKQDVGRLERGELAFQEIHRHAITQVLNVPGDWFTEPDVDVIIGIKPRAPLSLKEQAAALEQLLAGHVQATGQAGQGSSTPPADEDHQRPSREGGVA